MPTMSTFSGTAGVAGYDSTHIKSLATQLSLGPSGDLYFFDQDAGYTTGFPFYAIRKANGTTGALSDQYAPGSPFYIEQLTLNRTNGQLWYTDGFLVYRDTVLVAGNTADENIVPGVGTSAHLGHVSGLAVDPVTGDLYIRAYSGGGGRAILKLVGSTMTVLAGSTSASGDTDGTGTAARFNITGGSGGSMAVDDSSTVYALDQAAVGQKNIRKITPAGVVTHLCSFTSTAVYGSGTNRFDAQDICYASDGYLYVVGLVQTSSGSGLGESRVLKVDPATGALTTIFTTSHLLNYIESDNSGNLYLVPNGADALSHTIQKLADAFVAPPPISLLPNLSTLTDAFPASTLNSSKWTVASGSASVTSSSWLTVGSGDTLGVVESVNGYYFDHALVRTQPTPGGRASLIVNARTGSDFVKVSIDNDAPGSTGATVSASWSIGGVAGFAPEVTYSATDHAWLRITRGTTIDVETSPDGALWMPLGSVSITVTQLEGVKVQLTGTRAAIFDNFNLGTSTTDPPPTEPPVITDPRIIDPPWTPPEQSKPGTGGKTCARLIELIRDFSSAARQPIRIIDANTIEMVNVNAPLPTGWSISDQADLFHAATHELLAGEKVLSTLSGDLALNVSAELVRDDVRLVVSDWIMPEQLPMYGPGLASSLVRSVTWTFTPEHFDGSIEFKALPIPVNYRAL